MFSLKFIFFGCVVNKFVMYSKCSKISKHFLLSVFKSNDGYQRCNSQKLVRVANSEDPDQTASLEAV